MKGPGISRFTYKRNYRGSGERQGERTCTGLQFQERIEADAYRLGNGLAPACRVADYLEHRGTTQFGDVRPTYRPSVVGANLWDCLPDFAAL